MITLVFKNLSLVFGSIFGVRHLERAAAYTAALDRQEPDGHSALVTAKSDVY
jgi:hypothetical protein